MAIQTKNAISPAELLALISNIDPLLTTAQVAALLSVEITWLRAAREGRKEVTGPPYIKLGGGRTAPVRYRASDLKAWVANQTTHINTAYSSLAEFISRANPNDRWLYAVDNKAGAAIEFKQAANQINPTTKLKWIAHKDVVAGNLFSVGGLMLPGDVVKCIMAAGKGSIKAGLIALARK